MMTVMLLTEMAPLPGARDVAGLRAGADAARRRAFVALVASIALLATTQLIAERAPTREQTLPLAVLALAVFAAALPALAVTQYVWGARARRVRRRELELYGVTRSGRARPLVRLGVAGGWALTLLLGWTVPRFFHESALHSFADVLTRAIEALSVVSVAAGVSFALWWARDVVGLLWSAARSAGSPGDPWDPGRRARPHRPHLGAALRIGAVLAVASLVAARAHLWEPPSWTVYALLTTALFCAVVTDE